MKVKMGFFKCMESMARDMRHPYIPSTTVLGDMGSSHLPCRVVGEFDGRYQLYCSKGVLNTTFSRAEVIPMANGGMATGLTAQCSK